MVKNNNFFARKIFKKRQKVKNVNDIRQSKKHALHAFMLMDYALYNTSVQFMFYMWDNNV